MEKLVDNNDVAVVPGTSELTFKKEKEKAGSKCSSSTNTSSHYQQHEPQSEQQLDSGNSSDNNFDDSEIIHDIMIKEERLPFRDLIKQILITCSIHSIVIQAGINLSFSAVLLPQLAAEYNATHQAAELADNVIRIDTNAASWIASLVTLSLPLGALIVGSLMDKYGRKRIAMLTTVPFTVAWLMHYWANNVNVIYAARIIAGFGSGLSTVCLIYVAEMAHPKLRAMLLNLNSLFVCLGILITCAIGSVLHWRTMSICYAVLSISSCLSIFLLPESPHWLHSFKSQTAHATKILSWLYSNDRVFQIEERRLWDNQLLRQSSSSSPFQLLQSFTQPTVYKPVALLFVLFVLQQLTGCYVIVFYAVDIFKRIGNGMDEYKALIVLGAIRFVAAILSAITSLKVGRKILLAVSAIGMMLCALGAALSAGVLTSWCVLGYVAFGSVGVLVIPWTLIGELLPLKVRGKLGGVLFAIAYLLMFGLVKSFPYVVDIVQMRVLFYCLVAVNVVLTYFIVAWMPETLGKSFRQIEEYFLT